MSTARNWCVARGAAPVGVATTVYRVPTTHTLILKDVHLYGYEGVALAEVQLSVVQEVTGTYVMLLDTSGGTTKLVVWSGWMVLNPTDDIVIKSVSSNATYWISGALLDTGGQPMPTSEMPGQLPAWPNVPSPAFEVIPGSLRDLTTLPPPR